MQPAVRFASTAWHSANAANKGTEEIPSFFFCLSSIRTLLTLLQPYGKSNQNIVNNVTAPTDANICTEKIIVCILWRNHTSHAYMVSFSCQAKQTPNERQAMTAKYSFYIGLNDKDSKSQIIETITAYNLVNRIFIDNGVDGATITSGKGIYKHDNGEVVVEETIIVQVYEFGSAINVKQICAELKTVLNQESIAVEKQETNSELY